MAMRIWRAFSEMHTGPTSPHMLLTEFPDQPEPPHPAVKGDAETDVVREKIADLRVANSLNKMASRHRRSEVH